MISSFQFLIANFIAFMLSCNMPKVIYYNSNLGESLLNERHYLIGKYAKINNMHSRGDTVLLFNCQTFFYYMSFYLMYLSFVIINKLIDSIIMKGRTRTINMNKLLDSIILKRPSITMNDTYYIDTECDNGSCQAEDTFAEGTFAEGTFAEGTFGGGGGGSGSECGEDCEECWEDGAKGGGCDKEDDTEGTLCGGGDKEGSGDKECSGDKEGSRVSEGCGDEDCECNNTDNSNKCCDCVDEKCSYFCIDSECKIKCVKLD
jgi:hypothetical protein